MNFKFGKREKLKSNQMISELFEEGKSITSFPLKLYYLPGPDHWEVKAKAAISVPKKNFKKAVHRNKIKRLMREAYRLNKHIFFNNIEGNFAFLILYLGKELPQYEALERSLVQIFEKLPKSKK